MSQAVGLEVSEVHLSLALAGRVADECMRSGGDLILILLMDWTLARIKFVGCSLSLIASRISDLLRG